MTSSVQPGADTITSRASQLALVLLFLVSLFNYLDRYMLGILLPAIKADLKLSDTELGFLAGLPFALFYATMGIPIARLADRHPRRWVIAGAVAAWSAMTAVCGLAQNFWQLGLGRVLVGVGEAGASPPSHSLIADLVPPKRRAAALAVYASGSPVGILIGFMAGGLISQSLGWRPALFVFGLPGLALALAVFHFLPEPRRVAGPDVVAIMPLKTVLRTLLARRCFVHASVGSGYYAMLWLGLIAWLPSYFTRSFGMGIGEVGTKLALVLGVSQLIGLTLGGALSDKLAQRDARWYMWVCAMASLTPMPFYAMALLWPTPGIALLAVFPAFLFGIVQGGPEFAVIQNASGPRMRAVAAASYFLIVNVMGGIGSQLMGLLSDLFTPALGGDALRVSMLAVSLVFSLMSGWHFWWGARTVRADFAAAAAS